LRSQAILGCMALSEHWFTAPITQANGTQSHMREKILEATAAMLVAHGTQASMSKIAKQAGVATGSLYNHFENKDVLIRAVYEELGAIVENALVAGDDPNKPAADRLKAFIDRQIDFVWFNENHADLHEYLSNVPLLPREEVLDNFIRTSDFIAELLRQLQGEGWVIEGDVGLFGGFMGGGIRNTLKWQRSRGVTLTPEMRAQVHYLCLHGLRKDD